MIVVLYFPTVNKQCQEHVWILQLQELLRKQTHWKSPFGDKRVIKVWFTLWAPGSGASLLLKSPLMENQRLIDDSLGKVRGSGKSSAWLCLSLLQVDLGVPKTVRGIITQGARGLEGSTSAENRAFVRKYKLAHSLNSKDWTHITDSKTGFAKVEVETRVLFLCLTVSSPPFELYLLLPQAISTLALFSQLCHVLAKKDLLLQPQLW